MGSSWTRSKKVSPECVKGGSQSTDVSSSKHLALFRPLHIHGLLRAVRNRAQQDLPWTEPERAAGEDRGQDDTREGRAEQRGRASTEPRGARDGHAEWSSSGPPVPTEGPADGPPVPRPAEAHVPHTLWTCNGCPLLVLPVIQYDASEEELMDSIEREFS